jgi:hypothetical protein
MADQGIVSFSFDPASGNKISDAWCADLDVLRGAGQKLRVRTQISAGPANSLPIPGYQAAVKAWTDHGHDVAGVLSLEFDPPHAGLDPAKKKRVCYPNEPLGFKGDPLLNPYIDDATRRAEQFAQQLAPSGLKTYWVWNEPNLKLPIKPGDNCPPGKGFPPTTLAPQNFAALVWQGCNRLKAGGAEKVYAGGLSVLKDARTDPKGPYLAGYLEQVYTFLNRQGITTYPWDALSLNIEGLFDRDWTTSLLKAAQAVQQRYRDESPIVIGEWGVENGDKRLKADTARQTFEAIDSVFPTMYFFQHGQYFEGKKSWGATLWGAPHQTIVPRPDNEKKPLKWRPLLQSLWSEQPVSKRRRWFPAILSR